MSTEDLKTQLKQWSERWSLQNLDHTEHWFGRMSLCSFEPDEHLVHAGAITDTIYLLESGLVRLYYTTSDGKERNKAFFTGEQVTGAVSAAITGTSAPFSIQALEPTTAISFHYSDLLDAAGKNPDIARLLLQLTSHAFIRNEQREAMLLTLNAQERYAWVLENEPDLVGRVAQFHLASYLGVDAVSLSRLKKKFT